jgi:hypothetical protein
MRKIVVVQAGLVATHDWIMDVYLDTTFFAYVERIQYHHTDVPMKNEFEESTT